LTLNTAIDSKFVLVEITQRGANNMRNNTTMNVVGVLGGITLLMPGQAAATRGLIDILTHVR